MLVQRSLSVLALILLLAGCGGDDETAENSGDSETATPSEPDSSGEEMDLRLPGLEIDRSGDNLRLDAHLDNGQTHVRQNPEGVEIPADYPDSVPVPEFGKPTNVTELPGTIMVIYRISDRSVDDVATWFESELTGKGWEAVANTVSPDRATLKFTQADREVVVMVRSVRDSSDLEATVSYVAP